MTSLDSKGPLEVKLGYHFNLNEIGLACFVLGSQAHVCVLDISVPSAPANIKATASDQNTVLISWIPPEFPNGDLTHYSVFMKTMESGRQFTQHFEVYPPNTMFSVRGLNQVKNQAKSIFGPITSRLDRRGEKVGILEATICSDAVLAQRSHFFFFPSELCALLFRAHFKRSASLILFIVKPRGDRVATSNPIHGELKLR